MSSKIGHQLTAPLVRALATNANTSSFTAKTAGVIVEPSGNLVFPVADPNFEFRSRVRIWPIGLGANNDAYSFRVFGWTRIGSGVAPGTFWFYSELGEYSCILGNFIGVAASPVLNTEFFADTVAVVKEPVTTADVTNAGTTEVFSPANDTPAWIELRLRGVEKLEFDFDQTTNTPTCNLLLQFLGGPM